MAYDLVLMEDNKQAIELARKLGFNKPFFKNEIKKLGMFEFKEYSEKRNAIEGKKVKILLNPHLVSAKDSLHYRNSGLDHILCNEMAKNNVAMAISFDKVNNYIEIGRVMQNIRLCRKYKIKMLFFTFADNLYGLRAKTDLTAFLEILGMTPGEARNAFEDLK